MGVSLLIPCFNDGKWITETISTARQQTVSFDEIICCDDASEDDTLSILESLDVRVLRNESNSGSAATRNKLLKAANQPFVHFHDADDHFLNDSFLELLCPSLDSKSIVVCETKFKELNGDVVIRPKTWPGEDEDWAPWCLHNVLHLNAAIFPKEELLSFGAFREELRTQQDIMLFFEAAAHGLKFTTVRKPLAQHIKRTGSTLGLKHPQEHHLQAVRMCALALDRGYTRYAKNLKSKAVYHLRESARTGLPKNTVQVLKDTRVPLVPYPQYPGGKMERLISTVFGFGPALRYTHWRATRQSVS